MVSTEKKTVYVEQYTPFGPGLNTNPEILFTTVLLRLFTLEKIQLTKKIV